MLLLSLPWKSKVKTDESQAKVGVMNPRFGSPFLSSQVTYPSHLYRLEVHRAVYGAQFMVHTTGSNSKNVKVHFLSSRNCNIASETNYKYNTIRCTAGEARTC